MKTPFPKRLTGFVTYNAFNAVRFALAIALTATLFIGSAAAETYSLTTRVKPTEAGAGGLPSGKTYCDLTSSDTVNVTAANAQLYFMDSSAVTLNCNIEIKGDSYGSEKTGKFRMQMNQSVPVYLNGTVNLVGDTRIASHAWQNNQGFLYFNGQVTGVGSLVAAPGYLTEVHLSNTNSVNNYQGNTQIGSSGVYNNSGVTTYAGTLVLDADEQIPDVLTAGSTSTGNLVMYSWEDASNRLTSTLNLNGHTETINGLVCTDTLSVIKGSYGSKLRVGADNSSSAFSGKIQDGMQLEKIGTGTLTLSGENTHTGGTILTAGTLAMSSATALSSGSINFNGNSTLLVNIPNPEITNYMTFNSGVVGTINTNGQNVTLSGSLEGNGGLNKTGAGTLTLQNSCSAASITVSEGTLFLPENASMNSTNLTVQSGGTLQTDISLSNTNVSITGGTFILGSSPATKEVDVKSLSLDGGTIHFDINNNTGYYDSDWLTFTDSVNLNSGVIDLSFNYADEDQWWAKAGSSPIQLITTEKGGLVGDIGSNMQVTVSGFPTASWTLTKDSNNIFLSATDVPPGEGPFWFANSDDITADQWTIDGSEKYGAKLITGDNYNITYSNPVIMSADGTVEVGENYELTFGGQVSGTGAVDKLGAGTLILSQAPAYTGSTKISAGTMVLSAGGTLYNLSGAGNLDNNGQAVTINNTEDSQFSGVITGAGALTKSGNGTLTLSGANDYTGGTTISAGTLKVIGEGSLGTGAVNNSGILEFAPGEGETMSIGYTITNNVGAKTVKSGAGTLTTSNWIGHNVELQEGTLQITGNFGNGKRFNGQITIAQGATLLCATHDSLGYGESTTKMYIYGTMDNSEGNETLNNTELHMYGGTAKSSSGGTLDVLNTGVKFYSYALDGTTASNPTVSTISAPIRLRTDGSFDITTAENSQLNMTGLISTYSGNAVITKLGKGTLYLSAVNTFKGGIDIKEGKVISNGANSSPSNFGTGPVVIETGAVLECRAANQFGYGADAPNEITIRGTLIPADYTHIKNITLESGLIESEYGKTNNGTGLDFATRTGVVTSTGDSLIKCRFNINAGAKATFNVVSDTLTISGLIKSGGGFTKTGEGTLVLSSQDSSYTGNITINGGKLKATSGWKSSSTSPLGSVTSAKTITVNEGGELVLAAQDIFINAHSESPFKFVVDGGKISNEGATYNYLTNLTMRNGANLHAADGNATWKTYKLHNLKVERNADDTAGAPVTITADPDKPNAVIGFGGASSAISGGTSKSTITVEEITSANAAVNDNVSDLVISAVIVDPTYQTSGALKHSTEIIKAGAGTMELTAVNTYTGPTTVSEGTLLLSSTGRLASANVTVGENAAFQTGASIGSTNVALNGGSFIIGETSDSASITAASLTMNDGAVYFDFNGYTAAANDYDLLTTNSATLASGIVNLTFNNGDETSWWTNSTDSGYVLINSSSMGIDLNSVQLLVNSAETDSWYLTTADNNLVLMKLDGPEPPEPPVTDPYYYANTADISAAKWTIDGVNKKGVKFLEGNSEATYANPVELNMNGSFDIAAGHDLTVTGAISGAGALNKAGEGTLTLSGSKTFTGNITVDEGTLKVIATGALGNINAEKTVTINKDATLLFASHDVLGTAGVRSPIQIIVDGGTIANETGWFNTLNHVTLKNGGKIIDNNGHVNWQSYQLTGTVDVTADSKLDANQISTISIGTVGANNGVIPNGVTFNVADVTQDSSTDLLVSANLTNGNSVGVTGNFTKTGAGTMTLSGENTYTGVTTVAAGVLNVTGSKFNSRLVVQSGGTAVIDAGDGGTVNMAADGYASSVMIGNGSNGTFVLNSGNVTIRNGGNNTGSIQLGTNGNCTGVLTINGGAMQVDGRILLSANNDNAKGTLNMNGGTLTLGVPGAYTTGGDPACGVLWFGQGTTTVNLNGGTLALYGTKGGSRAGSTFNFNGGTIQAVADNNTDFFTAAGSIKYYIKQGGAIFDTNGHNVKVNAKIEQGTESADAAGGFTKKGEGTLTLSQAPAYTGSTTIEQGTLALPAGGTLYNLSGGKLNDDGSVAVSAKLDASGQALTLNNTETSHFVGSITANTVNKTGAGTLKILSTNGQFALGNFAVEAGELDFKGQYNGDLIVKNGATLSPGNSVGDMTVTGNVVFEAGATGLFEFSAYNADPALQSFDTLTINDGSLVIDDNAIIKLFFTSSSDAALWAAEGAEYKLVSNEGFVSSVTPMSGLLGNYQSLFSLEGRTDGLYLIGNNAGPEPDKYYHANTPEALAEDTWTIDGTNKEGIKFTEGDKTTETYTGGVEMNVNGSVEVAENKNLTLSGVVSGEGAMNKTGEGTLTLSGDNTYSGNTTVSEGKLTLTGDAVKANGPIDIADNATLEYNVPRDEKSLEFTNSNAVTGSNAIKTGAGTLKILSTDGQFAPENFTVEAGKLDFKGKYTGDLIVKTGTTFSPGNSVGDLTVYGNVIIETGATGLFEFSSYNEDPAQQQFDTLAIDGAGAFVIDENSIIKLYFENNDADLWATEGAEYQLVSDADFNVNVMPTLGNYQGWFDLIGKGDGLYLVGLGAPESTGVPEPSTWALLLLGAMGLLYMRKRK